MTLHLGLNKENARFTADKLEIVLANTFTIYTKTLNFHWNVVGADFAGLHALFQTQYETLALVVDEIAERIRMLGFNSPGTLVQFLKLTIIQEVIEPLSDAEMIQNLLDDHEKLASHIRTALSEIDDKDASTKALLENLMGEHEKIAWMLRAHLTRN